MFVPRAVKAQRKRRQHSPPLANRRPPSEKKVVVEDLRSEESKTEAHKEPVKEPVAQEEEDDEPVLSFSKCQRWPIPGEPVCVECGRYGAYIIDKTDEDICSLECKARRLNHLGILMDGPDDVTSGSGRSYGDGGAGESGWRYREHPEVASWSEEHVRKLRTELSVSVVGTRVPRPVSSLVHIPFPNQALLSNVQSAGYSALTAVQRQTIPAVLHGRDLLVQATTGAGKTFSFLLPLIIRILYETTPTQRDEDSCPRVVILTPTRELCMQIEQQAQQIMQGVPAMKTALVVGGLPASNQIYRLKSGVQIVIATPARLADILENHAAEVTVEGVEVLVLDEVDSLLQLGFEQQVREVEEKLPAVRQKLFFSATIPPRIEKMATELLQDHLLITVGEWNTPTERVQHTVLWVEEGGKKKKLFALLNNQTLLKPPVIIFVNSKAGTLLLAEAINNRCPHVATVCIHGDMTQERRTQILTGFLEGKYSAIVATGVLARGLDLKNVQQVFIFDMPSSIAEFVHQVGRAGGLDRNGHAFTFINDESKGLFLDLIDMLEPRGVELPSLLLHSPHLARLKERRKERDGGGRGGKRRRRIKKNFYHQSGYFDGSDQEIKKILKLCDESSTVALRKK